VLAAIVVMAIGSVMVAASLHIGPWKPQAVTPHRVSMPSAASATTPSTTEPTTLPASPSPSKIKLVPKKIAASAPVEVSIAGVMDVRVGGSITLEHSQNCRTAAACLFPPEDNGGYRQAWWYDYGAGSLPSVPSTDTTYILGHSYRFKKDAAFNNQPATRIGDIVVVRTKTGVFRYRAYKYADIPFAEMPKRQDVWGKMPRTLVLITCGLKDKSPGDTNPPPADKNHVVWAIQVG
jgi:hypothetical protein